MNKSKPWNGVTGFVTKLYCDLANQCKLFDEINGEDPDDKVLDGDEINHWLRKKAETKGLTLEPAVNYKRSYYMGNLWRPRKEERAQRKVDLFVKSFKQCKDRNLQSKWEVGTGYPIKISAKDVSTGEMKEPSYSLMRAGSYEGEKVLDLDIITKGSQAEVDDILRKEMEEMRKLSAVKKVWADEANTPSEGQRLTRFHYVAYGTQFTVEVMATTRRLTDAHLTCMGGPNIAPPDRKQRGYFPPEFKLKCWTRNSE